MRVENAGMRVGFRRRDITPLPSDSGESKELDPGFRRDDERGGFRRDDERRGFRRDDG
jgi:hypothetical protein